MIPENAEPDSSCLPRINGYIHSQCDHPSILRYHPRAWRFDAAGELPHITPDCHPGRCTIVLEAAIQSFWSSPHLPLVPDLQSGL